MARVAAGKSFVLLKNDKNVLPFGEHSLYQMAVRFGTLRLCTKYMYTTIRLLVLLRTARLCYLETILQR